MNNCLHIELETIHRFYELANNAPNSSLFLKQGNYYITFDEQALQFSELIDAPSSLASTLKIPYLALACSQLYFLLEHIHPIKRKAIKVFPASQETTQHDFLIDMYGNIIIPGDYLAYGPGHPWYYHLGGPITCPEYIKMNVSAQCSFLVPKSIDKISEKYTELQAELQKRILKYLASARILDRTSIDTCQSLSLTHNHVSYTKTQIHLLKPHRDHQLILF